MMELLSIMIVMMSLALFTASALAVSNRSTDAEQGKDPLPQLPEGKRWQLVWFDEFDGTEIDTSKWESPMAKGIL